MIDDIDGDEDEVFALKGLDDESGDDDDEEDEDVEMDYQEKTPNSREKDKKKSKKKPSAQSESEEEESEEETWGRSKSAYYSSNAQQLDSDDEEANELEEQEAKRLQAKSREELTEADFGLEDSLDIGIHEGTEYAATSSSPPAC
jgi:U3 small nucleolar RNA-associated protein 3